MNKPDVLAGDVLVRMLNTVGDYKVGEIYSFPQYRALQMVENALASLTITPPTPVITTADPDVEVLGDGAGKGRKKTARTRSRKSATSPVDRQARSYETK